MPSTQAAASSSRNTPTTSSTSRQKRRRLIRSELQRSLQIIETLLNTPQPSGSLLPPSPPSSPRPQENRKRKSPPVQRPAPLDEAQVKRVKLEADDGGHAEDGEIVSKAPQPAQRGLHPSAQPDIFIPIRRPRKGPLDKHNMQHQRFCRELYDRYHKAGRKFKWSGETRHASTYSPSDSRYRPLPNPPSPNSDYYKHASLISVLELTDALMCFAYSLWAQDLLARQQHGKTWDSMEGFLGWVRERWDRRPARSVQEKALTGLVYLLEGAIASRRAFLGINHGTLPGLRHLLESNVLPLSPPPSNPPSDRIVSSQPSPPTLPSPALTGSSGASNASSTPPNPLPQAERSANINAYQHHPDKGRSVNLLSIPTAMAEALVEQLTLMALAQKRFEQSQGIWPPPPFSHPTSSSLPAADREFTINTLGEAYPRTHARIEHSTLAYHEQHEPDMEDDDGELFFPGPDTSFGGAIAWLCLVGRAMVRELGSTVGYRGLDGCLRNEAIENETR